MITGPPSRSFNKFGNPAATSFMKSLEGQDHHTGSRTDTFRGDDDVGANRRRVTPCIEQTRDVCTDVAKMRIQLRKRDGSYVCHSHGADHLRNRNSRPTFTRGSPS